MPAAPRSHYRYCEGPLPCPPGESPFHMKGEFYRELAVSIAYNDQKSGGALRPALEAEGLLEFTTQTFLSSSFYDVLPEPRIIMVMARVRGWDVYDFTARLGEAAIERQMTGVYGHLMSGMTADKFCQQFPRIIRQFYDFGPVSVAREEGGARLVRTGVPLCVAEWWSLVTVPFALAPLRASGSPEATIAWHVEPRGQEHGIDVGDVVWDVRWAGR
jgi:hypothetical protein